jgi:hypothetical protein
MRSLQIYDYRGYQIIEVAPAVHDVWCQGEEITTRLSYNDAVALIDTWLNAP